MSKRSLGLIMSYEKGINKQSCPLPAYFGHDVFVFSMIACQQINQCEPGLQQQQDCLDLSEDERTEERAVSLFSVFLWFKGLLQKFFFQ